jgi:hypothetical protein
MGGPIHPKNRSAVKPAEKRENRWLRQFERLNQICVKTQKHTSCNNKKSYFSLPKIT